MDELVSIIVPVYNAERYLEDCIYSIQNQSYYNLEIILVDDGSNDNSPGICDLAAEKDHRIVVVHQMNQGQSAARNTGLDMSKGDFIGFVDSDDKISPIMIEACLREIREYDADVATVLDTTCIEDLYSGDLQNISCSFTSQPLLEYLLHEGHSVWRRIYKSELFDDIRFERVMHDEDVLLTYQILSKCRRAIRLNEKLYFWNQENASLSRGPVKTIDNQSEKVYLALQNTSTLLEKAAKARSLQMEYRILTRAIKYGIADQKTKEQFLLKYKIFLKNLAKNLKLMKESDRFSTKDLVQIIGLQIIVPIYAVYLKLKW